MDLEFFSQSLAEICAHSLISPGRPLRWAIIANPTAGGFAIRSRWKGHVRALTEYRQKAQANPPREIYGNTGMVLTDKKGAAEKITLDLIGEADKNAAPFYLIITAGGDGTSLEVLSAIYNAPAHVRSNIAVLRLPMGTGNDSADCAGEVADRTGAEREVANRNQLANALDLLIKPVKISFAPAVRLVTAPGGPACEKGLFIAFNILSVGLDAFVTHMTNKIKGRLPGDSYKLWVDVAALFYDRLYKVDFLDVRGLDEQNREIRSFREKLLLLAVGASGRRTYGSGQRILPNEHNVCCIKQTSLPGKLALKGLVAKGRHTDHPGTILFSARRLEIAGGCPLLAQMDGEAVLLQPRDFPIAIELTAPVIPLLKEV